MQPEYPAPLPYVRAFEQLGFGMFVHFGLYSQLRRGEWAYHIHGIDRESYRRLADTFRPGSMKQIVGIAKAAGCRYITLTARHHDGFSLYDTRGLSSFDVMHTPLKRDLVAEFVEECRSQGLLPFFYHTTLDWMHPDFEGNFEAYLDYLLESVSLLCTNYGKIGGIWFDGNWSRPDAQWQEDRLYKQIHRLQPEAMIINNTGLSARGELGHPEIDAVTYERGMPNPPDLRGHSKYVAGEMCQTLCDHWGIADDIHFKSVGQLIEELCQCRKVGANFLLNIGPNADGTVEKIQEATMECIGRWMGIYGEAIYHGRPYRSYPDREEFLLKDDRDPSVAYLFRFHPGQASGDSHVTLEQENANTLSFPDLPEQIREIQWMDNGERLLFRQEQDRLTVHLTGFPYGQNLCVRVAKIRFN